VQGEPDFVDCVRAVHGPRSRAKSRVRAPAGAQTGHLDWSDRAAVRALMLSLRVHLDDLIGVVDDMQAAEHERELGPATHRRIYDESKRSLLAGLAFALPPESSPPAP
jgi:hypothetical protein